MSDLIQCWGIDDGDSTEPEECWCETFGWPHRTTTGAIMYDNRYFRTKAEAWEALQRSVDAQVEMAASAVTEARAALRDAEARAADAVVRAAAFRENRAAALVDEPCA